MDEIRIRELPQKGSSIALSDLIIVEDEDGTKTIEASAFKSMVQQSLFFDTVEDMKSASLHEGDIIRTLGYRSANDGGGAYYLITYSPTDVEDGIYIHYLHTSDTLRAHYIQSDAEMNVIQAGVYANGKSDDFSVLQQLLDDKIPVVFPSNKTYRVSGSLDVPSDTVIDLNGSTFICESTAAFCLGLDKEAKNITLKNGRFVGINGIELYTNASEITISNCEFYGSDKVAMSKGIFINGASNVQIDNIKIGAISKGEVKYGIYMSNGTGEDDLAHYNYNVQMSNLSIITSTAGIFFSGTYVDKNISVVDFSVEGYNQNRANSESFGVIVGSNSDSISLSNGKIKNVTTALTVTGIISAVLALTDISVDDCDIMYNFASAGSTIHLYGLHRFTGNSTNNAYVFDRLTSDIVLQGVFDGDRDTSRLAGICKTSMVGDLIDVVSPVGRKKISVTSMAQLNDESVANVIPGYKNVSLNLEFSGTITELNFPSLSGQVIALYSDVGGCVLSNSTKLRVPSDITLSQYEPVLLRNNSGIWTMVQFGGSSDGSSGGTGGGSVGEIESLSVYFGNNKDPELRYNGKSPKDLYITPAGIGASKLGHTHATNDITGIQNIIPASLKNPNPIKIHLNGGDELGVNYFEYDGTQAVEFNITSTGGGGGGTVDLSAYAKKNNFTGTGYFSVNRKDSTEPGNNSIAMGTDSEATKENSVAIGDNVSSTAKAAVALGENTKATAEAATAKGANTTASGRYSEASGKDTFAVGEASFTMGTGTTAHGNNQLVLGRYNVDDTTGQYVNIVGNGTEARNRKNIYTLDWNGNGVYIGTVTAAEPTTDNHLTTKHYVDEADKNINTRVTEALATIATLSTLMGGAKGFTGTGYEVTDWDDVDANGIVYADQSAQNSPPSLSEGSTLIAFAMLTFEKVPLVGQATEEGEQAYESVLNSGMVIGFNPDDSFEFQDDDTMGFPFYIRQVQYQSWGDWYKVYIGHGDVDVAEE